VPRPSHSSRFYPPQNLCEFPKPYFSCSVPARFSTPVQTGPGAHPASYIMGTGSFPGAKRPGRGINHPPHLMPRLKKE
jgi:hypothetical protein